MHPTRSIMDTVDKSSLLESRLFIPRFALVSTIVVVIFNVVALSCWFSFSKNVVFTVVIVLCLLVGTTYCYYLLCDWCCVYYPLCFSVIKGSGKRGVVSHLEEPCFFVLRYDDEVSADSVPTILLQIQCWRLAKNFWLFVVLHVTTLIREALHPKCRYTATSPKPRTSAQENRGGLTRKRRPLSDFWLVIGCFDESRRHEVAGALSPPRLCRFLIRASHVERNRKSLPQNSRLSSPYRLSENLRHFCNFHLVPQMRISSLKFRPK